MTIHSGDMEIAIDRQLFFCCMKVVQKALAAISNNLSAKLKICLILYGRLTRASGAPIAQLGELQTFDRKVESLILTRGAVLCP